MTGGAGIRAAAELALQAGAGGPSAVPAEAEAPELFEPSHGGEGGGPLDPMAELGADLFGQPRRGRGGGRPKGSRNKVTETFRAYFLSLHKHPALALAEIASVPVEELARRLGCDRFDALKLQTQCLTAILPYVEKRQPIALELPAGSGLTLVIGDLAAPGAAGGPAIDGDFRVAAEGEEDQGLAAGAAAELVAPELVDGPEAQADRGLAAAVPLTAHQPAPAADGAAAVSITQAPTGPDTATPGGVPEAADRPPSRAAGRAEPLDQKNPGPAEKSGGAS